MGRETHKKPEVEMSEQERSDIAQLREIIAEAKKSLARNYGVRDDPESLTELGYEQRMARARALELTVQLLSGVVPANITSALVCQWADTLYEYIWEGRHA